MNTERVKSQVLSAAARPLLWGLDVAAAGYGLARSALPMGRPGPHDAPRLSGELPLVGHMVEFARNPFQMLMRARAERGEVVEFKLLNQDVVMLTGPKANEAFFRAPDDQICRREAYKVMTPIFGKGVVFDAPLPRMNRQLQMVMPMLRDNAMRAYPAVVGEETERLIRRWGQSGELDILAFTKELTIYTSTHCLIGEEFRRGISDEFFELFEALESGVDALAYFAPNLPIPKFRRRDAARAKLQGMIEALMHKREGNPQPPRDGLQTFIESTYEDGTHLTPNELTGILVALLFAGHHTSAGTAVWILVELLRNPQYMEAVVREVDAVTGGKPLTYGMLREMTTLGGVIKEVLRLHPPLIFLFRKVLRDFHYGDYVVPAGKMLCAAPAVTHRIGDVFHDPDRFDPGRYADEAQDHPSSWIGFGGGKHKCTGNAFGTLQLKAITATLLSRFEFEMVSEPADYVDDYTKPTVQPRGPCLLRYRARAERAAAKPMVAVPSTVEARSAMAAAGGEVRVPTRQLRVVIDRHLCQGHAVCVSEAPEIFKVGDDSVAEVALAPDTCSLQKSADKLIFLPSQELNQQVTSAARFCPNKAITIEELVT